MFKYYEENKKLKEENTQLRIKLKNDDYCYNAFLKKEQYYNNKIDYLEEKIIKLQKELTDTFVEKLEKALKQPIDKSDNIEKRRN